VLVLQRHEDEAILIPQLDIEIVVVSIRGNKVRLGILAPDHIDIYREEVWEAMDRHDFNNQAGDDDNGTEDHQG
jgi:carbon storage regulator